MMGPTVLVVNSVGAQQLIANLLASWGPLALGLFIDEHMPDITDTTATYQAIEATFAGYARQTITGWLAPQIDGNGVAYSLADILMFTRTASGPPVNVYGYFVVNPGNYCLWGQLDPNAPQTLRYPGDTYTVIPSFSLLNLC